MFKRSKTPRGFKLFTFKDRNGENCSLQESSAIPDEDEGDGYVWLGTDKDRMHLTQHQAFELAIELLKFSRTGELDATLR